MKTGSLNMKTDKQIVPSVCGLCIDTWRRTSRLSVSACWYIQPVAFGVSFNLNLQSQSHWSLFNGRCQKRPRGLDLRLGFEIEETALSMQYVIFILCLLFEYWRRGAVTGWRRLIGCLKLQVILRKRGANYRALLRKMTCEDKASYGSSLPCS